MKIIAISHYYAIANRGGGEVMLHQILKRLVDEGHQVDAVATDTEAGVGALDGVTVYQGAKYKEMLTKEYDLVLTQFENTGWVLDKAKELKVPSVLILHDNHRHRKETLATHKPDLVVFNSEWIRRDMQYKGNSIVVHPPVYAEDHATEPGTDITLVNLLVNKGANTFYNLAQHFPKEQFLGVRGGYFKKNQVIINRKNVTIIDSTMDMKRDVWSRTRILLMPSMYESYGMAGVEAMASGIPVIARRTPGLEESLSYAGIFPTDNSIGAWKREIAKLQNPVYYKLASEKAKKRSAELDPEPELAALMVEIGKIV